MTKELSEDIIFVHPSLLGGGPNGSPLLLRRFLSKGVIVSLFF